MNNFKTVLSAAVLISMASAAQATDVLTITGSQTGAGTVNVVDGVTDKWSVVNGAASNTISGSTVATVAPLGDVLGNTSTVTLDDAATTSFVISYSANGNSANQALTQVHDEASITNLPTASVVELSALQGTVNTHGGGVTATGTMGNLIVEGANIASVVYAVSATGSAVSQSVTPMTLVP